MNESKQPAQFEPRWPSALAVLAVLLLLAALPGRITVFPAWVPYALAVALLIPMAAIRLTGASPRWVLVDRATTLLFFLVALAGILAGLVFLIRTIVGGSSDLDGLQLLTSSIAVWVTNVLVFSLLYWQIDRGGPEARANNAVTRPDWLFPQSGVPDDSPPGWRPTFVDYLFLGYSTATAFSTTDTVPLTSRAKVLMMFESSISMVTIIVVAARALNILGS